MDFSDDELVLHGSRNLSVEQLLSTEINLSEDGNETEDPEGSERYSTKNETQYFSPEQLQICATTVSSTSGPAPIQTRVPIMQVVQAVDEEVSGAGMVMMHQSFLATTAAHRIINALDLPNELILNILSYLSWRDIVRYRCVCRWVRDTVDRSANFQYRITLGLSALEDGPNGGLLSPPDRLRLLINQQQAWRNLARCNALTFPIPFIFTQYDFSGGIFKIGTAGSSELHHIRLPTAMEVEIGIGLKWSRIQLGFKIRDFAMDIEQDLLVLIELPDDRQAIRFHFWTISTHNPHPAASSATLELPSKSPIREDFRIQIVGSHIALILRSKGGRLIIYSWTTGHTRANVHARPGCKLRSVAFISPHVFVIPWKLTLDLYSFNPESIIHPVPVLTPLVSFQLPEGCHPDTFFQCRAHPCPPSDHGHLKSAQIEIPTVPFSTDSEDGIITIWLDGKVVFVVHRSTLMSHLNNWDHSQQVKIVNWHSWGPKNTRWFDTPLHDYWLCTMSGHRLVMVEPTAEDHARKFIVVLDFNPALVSKARTRSVASDLVTAPSLAGNQCFETPIQSELPYLETRSSEPFICSAAIIDQHRILAIQDVGGEIDATLLLP